MAADRDTDTVDGIADKQTHRSFTCLECGYAIEREVSLLRSSVSEVCVHCNEYAVHMADHEDLEAAGGTAAVALAEIGYLTKRQAAAYVYRELLGFTRAGTAGVMNTSKSNVDNLQRRATQKVAQADRFVTVLQELRPRE